MGIGRRGRLNQIGHQPQHIRLIFNIYEGIISVRLLHVDQIQNTNVIAIGLENIARTVEHLLFGIGDDIAHGAAVEQGGNDMAATLSRSGTSNHQNIEVAPVLMAVQTQADMLCQQ